MEPATRGDAAGDEVAGPGAGPVDGRGGDRGGPAGGRRRRNAGLRRRNGGRRRRRPAREADGRRRAESAGLAKISLSVELAGSRREYSPFNPPPFYPGS